MSRSFGKILNRLSIKLYTREILSRDEQCVNCNHKISLRHIKLPKKFITVGIRIEAHSTLKGVIINFLIDFPGVSHYDQSIELLKSIPEKGHVIFMDRLYTSFKLVFDSITKLSQYICGTCRGDRGFPHELTEGNIKLKIGDWDWMQKRGIFAYSWYDSQILSSFHDPKQSHVDRRVKGVKGKVSRVAPVAFVDYNIGMGGNDVGDMLRSRMTVHTTSKKWWHCLFYYIIDQAIIATFRIWNLLVPNAKLHMRNVIKQIIYGLISS